MTTAANMVEAAVFKCLFCVCYWFAGTESSYKQRSDRKPKMKSNTMELGANILLTKKLSKEIRIFLKDSGCRRVPARKSVLSAKQEKQQVCLKEDGTI